MIIKIEIITSCYAFLNYVTVANNEFIGSDEEEFRDIKYGINTLYPG